MQFYQEDEKKSKANKAITIAVFVLIIVAVIFMLRLFIGGGKNIRADKLRCVATQEIMPFGNTVLFYDGTSLVCLNSNGSEKWSYAVGEDASFDACDSAVAIWSGSQLSILDRNGHSTYDDNMGESIQFARISSKYVGVVLGDDNSINQASRLVILDLYGNKRDEENAAYEDKLILDLGFFADGEYLWTTSMNLYGTVPSTTLNTYQVGVMTIGDVDLGDTITYKIVYADTNLHAISTRQMRTYDYRGKQDIDSTQLVYGWQLIDHAEKNNQAELLFAPTRQTNDLYQITQLRYLYGKTDKRFTLPDACVGASFMGNKIYAFSDDGIYRADISGQRFSVASLPANMGPVTSYIGLLSNGVALLACENDVYAVTVP